MSSVKTTGIILRRHDYGEADRMYEFLTPDRKRSAVAKSVRKAGARLSSHLELFAEIDLMIVEGRGSVGIVTSARVKRHIDLSVDYERLRRGFLFLEMTDKLTDTEDTSDIYMLLASSLRYLYSCDPLLVELWFKLRLLNLLGQAPRLDRDSTNTLLQEGQHYSFDVRQGSLNRISSSGNISPETIKLWRLIAGHDPESLQKVARVGELAAGSIDLIDRFILEQSGMHFKAAEM